VGLPHLAGSGLEGLAEVARLDSEGGSPRAIGDAWWEQRAQRTGLQRERCGERARHWYLQAIEACAEADRELLAERLTELTPLTGLMARYEDLMQRGWAEDEDTREEDGSWVCDAISGGGEALVNRRLTGDTIDELTEIVAVVEFEQVEEDHGGEFGLALAAAGGEYRGQSYDHLHLSIEQRPGRRSGGWLSARPYLDRAFLTTEAGQAVRVGEDVELHGFRWIPGRHVLRLTIQPEQVSLELLTGYGQPVATLQAPIRLEDSRFLGVLTCAGRARILALGGR
jgi:hypothetical protein